MTGIGRYPFVLAVYPNTRGFAFVLFESALSLVDWGAKEIRGAHKNALCLARIESLLVRYQPQVLVIQDTHGAGTWRADRIAELNSQIAALGGEYGMKLVSYSRQEIFAAFGAMSKQEIAMIIAERIEALARYLPPRRKAWMTEPASMALFDAAALGLTFLSRHGGSLEPPVV